MMQAHLTLLPLFLALLLNLQPTSSEPCTSSFTSSLLSRTNYHRKFHHSPPLALNASLSARAQAWADQLLASGSQAARHRPNRRLSENLFLKITDSGVQLSAEVVVDSWYAGSQLYGQFYGGEPNLADFSSWRYFTAMIWAASRQVGIGCSTEILDSGKRITYVVANFSPRGNVVGGFKENVRRPKRKVEVYQTTFYNRTSTTKTSTAKTPSYSPATTKATTSRKPYKKPASTRPTSTTTTTTAKPSSPTTTTTKKYPSTATTKSTTTRTTRKAPATYSTTKSTKTSKPTTAKTNKPTTTKAYPKTTRKTSTSATKYTSATKRTTTTTKAPASTSTPPAPTIFYQPSYSNQNIPYSNPNFYHHHRPQYYRPRPRPPPPPPSSSIFSHEDLLDLHEAASLKWPPSRPKPVFYLPPNYQNSKPLPARPSSFPFKPLPLSSFLSPNLPNFHHYPPSPHQKHVFRPSFYRPVYKPVKFYKHTQNNPVVKDYNNNNSVRRSVNTNSKQKQ